MKRSKLVNVRGDIRCVDVAAGIGNRAGTSKTTEMSNRINKTNRMKKSNEREMNNRGAGTRRNIKSKRRSLGERSLGERS